MGALATKSGCDLIMAPDIRLDKYGDEALLLRQRELLHFLEDAKATPDVNPVMFPGPSSQNKLIVGDWFYAESREPGPTSNYSHVWFTWHAPTVLQKIEEFDGIFKSIQDQQGIATSDLRTSAQVQLKRIIQRTEERIANPSPGRAGD